MKVPKIKQHYQVFACMIEMLLHHRLDTIVSICENISANKDWYRPLGERSNKLHDTQVDFTLLDVYF